MRLKFISAGSGYRYWNYLRGRALDGAQSPHRLRTGRPLLAAVPEGRWQGRGATALGVSGVVSADQMQALFGLGLHPNAGSIIAAGLRDGDGTVSAAARGRAWRAARLGPPVLNLSESSPLDRAVQEVVEAVEEERCRPLTAGERRQVRLRIAAVHFEEEYRRRPADGAELGRFAAARSGPQRISRTGLDLVFSFPDPVLWALLPPWARAIAEVAHEQAIVETLAYLEDHALAVRTGPGGAAQEKARPGLIVARFRHYASRAGDPMLHDHAVLSTRVQGPDGRWRTLDSRLLLREVVNASELYNQRSLELTCAALGVRTETVEVTPGQRPVMRIAGINPEIRALYDQRGQSVRAVAEELLAEYARRYDRQPAAQTRYRLLEQARARTRPAAPASRPLPELLTVWRQRAVAAVGAGTVDELLTAARAAASAMPTQSAVDTARAAAEVLAEVTARRATFHRRHVLAEARRYLMRTTRGLTADGAAADEITDLALTGSGCIDITPPDLNPPHPDLQRADGTSVYRAIGGRTYTTSRILAAEDRLLAASTSLVLPPVAAGTFARTAALYREPLDVGQRALAYAFCCGEQQLIAGLGPAGAGKTTAMRLVAKAVSASGGRLIPLAPSARAAKVLQGDLGVPAHTLHSWLHQRDRATSGKVVDDLFHLSDRDVVLVDEAGMAGTLLLDKVLAHAAKVGARVRLLGDPSQLAAAEAGGVLRLVARRTGAVELDRLHRFTTPGEGDASLLLRDSPRTDQAFTWYRARDRITAGSHEAMCEAVHTAWQRDTERGLRSVMTAADNDTVRELNARAQAWRHMSGQLVPGRGQALRDGHRAFVGDVICTRRNSRTMIIRRDFVKNGDLWTVTRITRTGDVIARSTTHRGRVRLPRAYVMRHCELGYASSIHRAQGMTVDTSHALATARSTREHVYVQLTRGARTNRLYLALDPGDSVTRVLSTIAARRHPSLSATETIADLQDTAADPARLAAEFSDISWRATTARLTSVLNTCLGDRAAQLLAGDAFGALARALADAEAAGFTLPRLLEHTGADALASAEDPAALLTWRIRWHLADAARAIASADPARRLATLSLTQLHHLRAVANQQRAAAAERVPRADASLTDRPTPVTTRSGMLHPAWPDRIHGDWTRTELAIHLAAARRAYAFARHGASTASARATWLHLAALTEEAAIRQDLAWRDRAREDSQRQTRPAHGSRATDQISDLMAAAPCRQDHDSAHVTLADNVIGRIDAELRLRDRLPDGAPRTSDLSGPVPDWVTSRAAMTDPDTPAHWRSHLTRRHRILARALHDRGAALAATPSAQSWLKPLGPPPAGPGHDRESWHTTAALVELWRGRRHLEPTVPGLGPPPTTTDAAHAYDDLQRRIRPLLIRHRGDHSATNGLVQPALHVPGSAPLNFPARHIAYAAAALAAVLGEEPSPDSWLDRLSPPGAADQDEQHAYTSLVSALSHYRERHHLTGHDPLGPRPNAEDTTDIGAVTDADEWDQLSEAVDRYQHTRITARLEQILARTAASAPTPTPGSRHRGQDSVTSRIQPPPPTPGRSPGA
ncbi:MobF family relaxase [Streptomyces sp. NPDC051976]|uniref:MobF family relaxase n=1 Tax=Streptomyces sp. NPDC051976 TaxID=3154947 RepID=UPI0034158E28